MKEVINIVNEYLLTVNLANKNKLYKVYAPNEKIAFNKFIDICNKYMQSDNLDNKEHWQQQHKAMVDGNYNMLKIEDFMGVREIL